MSESPPSAVSPPTIFCLGRFDAPVAELVKIARHTEAGCAGFDHDDADAAMSRLGGPVSFTQDGEDLSVASVRDKQLAAVDDVAVAIAHGRRFN